MRKSRPTKTTQPTRGQQLPETRLEQVKGGYTDDGVTLSAWVAKVDA
jgi:hypothetical protein